MTRPADSVSRPAPAYAARSRLAWGLGALLCVVTVGAYAPVFEAGFVSFDDPDFVTENPLVLGGLSGEAVSRAFTTAHASNWIPLVWISWMLDFELFGLDPLGYHLTNLLLHLASTGLLLAASLRLTGALGSSLFVAGVFALHPLHVESVAWITERKDTLSGVFWMAALLGYTHYVARPGALRYLGILIPFALGLLSKATLVTFPFVLLLLDHWPADRLRPAGPEPGRLARRALVLAAEKAPLLALSALASGLTLWAQSGGGAVVDARFGLGGRVANALHSYAAYLRLALWPTDLVFFHPHPRLGLTDPAVWASLVLLLVLGSFCLWRARHWRSSALLVGWLWFLGVLVPTIGIVQVGAQGMADRNTYLPLVGLSLAVACGLPEIQGRPALRRGAWGLGTGLLLLWAAQTHAQCRVWQDSESLYHHALSVDPSNPMAHYELARFLNGEKRFAEAEAHARAVTEQVPGMSDAHLNLGVALAGQGRHEEAIRAYRQALARQAPTLQERILLVSSLANAGRHLEARRQLRELVALDPGNPMIRLWVAESEEALGQTEAALAGYRHVLALGSGTRFATAASRRVVGLVDGWPEASLPWLALAAELADELAAAAPEDAELAGAARRLRRRHQASAPDGPEREEPP